MSHSFFFFLARCSAPPPRLRYVTYGPLLCGATQVVFEGVPTYPTASRLWEIVDKHQVKATQAGSGRDTRNMGFGEV